MDANDQAEPAAMPTPQPGVSDHSLLRRFRGGNQDAATALYLRYVHRVRALVQSRCTTELTRRQDPDDIVQSVFRRFFSKVCKGGYDVPAGEELWGLLMVIALNKIRNEEQHHRAGKRDVRLTHHSGDAAHVLGEMAQRDDSALQVLQLTVSDVLAELNPAQQTMVELRIQGHEIGEIATKVGKSRRTIERNLQAVREKLQALLG